MEWTVRWRGGDETTVPAGLGGTGVALLAVSEHDDEPSLTIVNEDGDVVWLAPRSSVGEIIGVPTP